MELTIIGILVSVILGFLIYFLQRRDTLSYRSKLRQSQKLNLVPTIGKYRLKQNISNVLVYGVDLSGKKRVSYYELPLGLANECDSTIENIHITLRFAEKSELPIDRKWIKTSHSLEDGVMTSKYQKLDNQVITTTSVKYINPKMFYEVRELFNLKETRISIKSQAVTKDKVPVDYEAVLHLKHKVTIQVDAKNISVMNFNLFIQLIDINKNDSLQESVNKINEYLNEEYSELKPLEKYEYLNNNKFFYLLPELIEHLPKPENEKQLYYGRTSTDRVFSIDFIKNN